MISEKSQVEKLLQPRYRVSDMMWPGRPATLKKGAIVHGDDFFQNYRNIKIADFPHLFTLLQWWEDRKLEELPQFVRVTQEYLDLVIKSPTSRAQTLLINPYMEAVRWDYFKEYGEQNFNQPFIISNTLLEPSYRLHAKWMAPVTKQEFIEQNLHLI
jgi:hypothetical protein